MKGGVAWLKSLIKCYKRTPKLLLLTSSFLLFELSVSLLLGALPVSYTHLDVYKRQDSYCEIILQYLTNLWVRQTGGVYIGK